MFSYNSTSNAAVPVSGTITMLHLRREALGFLLLFFTCYLLLLVLQHRTILLSVHGNQPYAQAGRSNSLLEPAEVVRIDRCRGRRVYVYELPRELNSGLLEKCSKGLVRWLDFCRHVENFGLGQAIDSDGWYGTDAYMLEVIFHSRIHRYSCLTHNAAQADAFFVPYYAGLEALRYLYGDAADNRYQHGEELLSWLTSNASDEWQRWQGKDHFMVLGRTSWDFATTPGWGTGIQRHSHISNMTTLYIERNPWMETQIAVPYPTSFHPSNSTQLERWLHSVRDTERKYLFSFSGGIRATMVGTNKRALLLGQCRNSSRCVHVDCGRLKCGHDPRPSVTKFLQSDFCLQPRGDTPTRRSAFDAIISGCIPVFFHQDSAYSQYLWHLPSDGSSYSVFIAEELIKKEGGIQIEAILSSFSSEAILRLRSKLISLIPGLIYRMPEDDSASASASALPPDAFDISLDKAMDRISQLKRT